MTEEIKYHHSSVAEKPERLLHATIPQQLLPGCLLLVMLSTHIRVGKHIVSPFKMICADYLTSGVWGCVTGSLTAGSTTLGKDNGGIHHPKMDAGAPQIAKQKASVCLGQQHHIKPFQPHPLSSKPLAGKERVWSTILDFVCVCCIWKLWHPHPVHFKCEVINLF